MFLRIGARKKAMILVALILAMSGGLFALEPPTKRQLAEYRLDGTLARRIADAKALGNDRVNPVLLQELQIRLDRTRLKALGVSDAGIDGAQPVFPPGNWTGLHSKGNNKVFVLLIDFPDYPASQTMGSIDGKIFGDGAGGYPRESLRNYYRRSSYNQLEIQGATLGWYRPAYTRAGVVQNSGGREDLIKEALTSFDLAGHDFSQYDNDNNGVIDYFLVIWTGPPGAWASFWWGYYTGWNSSFVLDGKQFSSSTYSWQWESYPYPGTFSPYVTIHETGHALGLPDLYDYDDTVGPRGGVGGLDMMDANRGDHNGFSKMLLDWLTPQVLGSGSQTYALRPTGSYPDAVIFRPGYNIASPFTEFFMAQNRTRENNDSGLPADGLLIWHIDATLGAWNDFLYDNSYTAHKLVRLMEADGLEEIEQKLGAGAGDYYVPGKAFGTGTVPNTRAYSGSLMNVDLGSISISASDISCRIAVAAAQTIMVTSPAGGEAWIIGTTQGISWLSGGVSGNLNINLYKGTSNLGAIAAGIPAGNGVYNWKAGYLRNGTKVALGSTYRVSIVSAVNKNITAVSNANFSLVKPKISVKTPANGTIWKADSVQRITWTYSAVNGTVDIFLYRYGVLKGQAADSVPVGDLGFSWTVGTLNTGKTVPIGAGYSVRVKTSDGKVSGSSGGTFTIRR
jgi:M6 family metalloprotease-like protein